MKRQALRVLVAASLVSLTILLGILWNGKYESSPDPKARFEVEAVKLKQDRGYVWLEAHLKKNGKKDHDLRQPVRLVTSDGVEHQPSDTTFAGSPEKGFTDIWFKFWLEKEALPGEMNLKLNGGTLKIKSSKSAPVLSTEKDSVFQSSNWDKSWLGF